MKHISALLPTAAALLCLLTACGNDRSDGAASDTKNGTAGSSVSDELKTDPVTGTRYTGRETDGVVRYGNGYGNTNADKRAKGGVPSGAARGRAELTHYEQMLDNARVRDTDGFLLDGENAQHKTLW